MSETAELPTGIAWGDPISDERLAELKGMFERQKEWLAQPNRSIEQSVFYQVPLTGADVFWLAVLALAEQKRGDLDKAVQLLRNHTESKPFGLANLHLEGASLTTANLEAACLSEAHLEQVDFSGAQTSRVNLLRARLKGASFWGNSLNEAFLAGAQLEDANLLLVQFEGANLTLAHLERANLTKASFDKTSSLAGAFLDGAILDQVIFDNTNLTVVTWEKVRRIGDEHVAKEAEGSEWKAAEYHVAARAYRSLSVALRNQGLSADTTRFHYRAELMERNSAFWQTLAYLRSRHFYTAPVSFGRWLFSWLLGTFAGYGDYFGRLLLTYLIVVSAFAGLMFLAAGRVVTFDAIRDVFVLSITSFHGRGVQPPGLTMTDALATLTAVEAFFGLLIEGIFIAAFTRRVTGN